MNISTEMQPVCTDVMQKTFRFGIKQKGLFIGRIASASGHGGITFVNSESGTVGRIIANGAAEVMSTFFSETKHNQCIRSLVQEGKFKERNTQIS